MKSMKHIAISALVAFSVLCIVWYSSCSKDACKGITCLNFGTCSGGACVCDSGTGGNNCEVVYRQLYANTYSGSAVYTISTGDTVNRAHSDIGNTLVFSNKSDTLFDKMQVKWSDNGSSITFPIVLKNNTSAGSEFTITGSVAANGYNYRGSGVLSVTSASMTLIRTDTISPPVTITLGNFTR